MPSPTGAQLKPVDVLLSGYSHRIMQAPGDFAARRIFGMTPVMKQSDRYATYTDGDWNRTDVRKRVKSSVAPTVGYQLSSDTYYADAYDVRTGIDDFDRANADDIFNLQQDATELVTQHQLIKQEVDWVATFFVTGVWGTSTAVAAGDQWENSGSTPIETVRNERFEIQAATGLMGNTMVVGSNVHKRLLDHPDVIARMKSGDAITDAAFLARVFGVDEYFVLNGVRNSAAFGDTTSVARIEGNHCLICHVNRSGGSKVPTAGRNFVWNGIPGGAPNGDGQQIRTYREEAERTDFVESIQAYDFKIVGSTLGRILTDAVGS